MQRRWGMGEAVAARSTRSRRSRTRAVGAPERLADSACPRRCTRRSARRSSTSIPAASGAAIGDTSHRDFRRLAGSLPRLDDGGVVLNLGSAVIMPEVFLKALTIARNLHEGRPRGFVTCDLDMQRHYRPRMNVVQRPTIGSGRGYEITGHHEIMVPLLAWAVVERLAAPG
jgi:hypothetical protein